MPILHSPPDTHDGPEKLKRQKGKRPSTNKSRGLHEDEMMGPGDSTPSAAQSPGAQPEISPPSQAAPTAQVTPVTATGTDASPTQQPSQENKVSSISASPQGGVIIVDGVEFHHASEAEFARLLSYYGIEWQYEPHQFPLQWHEGRPVEMFSPDFYLTEYDLYIELTTMRQSLVRRKNRKLRLLRALYPEINIKLLYRRDYQRLLQRFGIRPEEIEAEQAASLMTESDEIDARAGEVA